MKNKKKLLAALIMVIILAAGFFIFRYMNGDNGRYKDYKLEKVSYKKIHRTILATGTVKPVVGAEVKVGSRISGFVESLMVRIGDKVKKGETIAVIEHRDLLAKVEQAKANLDAAEVDLAKLELNLEMYRKVLPADVERAGWRQRVEGPTGSNGGGISRAGY